jgi:iron-sulfur cluster assembly protein
MNSEILKVSQSAINRLKEIVSTSKEKSIKGVRISLKSGGCAGMTYDMNYVDQESKGDEILELEGLKIFIDPKAVMFILGTEMDYKTDKFSSSFIFKNPNEIERCGCGESFKI